MNLKLAFKPSLLIVLARRVQIISITTSLSLAIALAAEASTTNDVIVVGAGSAGLYAAKTLQNLGYDVLIIEATDRIGGRIKSATLGDMRVELGAEEHYLALGENPVWPAMRNQYGDDVYTDPYQGVTVYSMDNGEGTCWTAPVAVNACSYDSDIDLLSDFWDRYWRPELHLDPSTSVADEVLAHFGVGMGHRAYHLFDSGIAGGSFATNLDKLGARSLAVESNGWDLSDSIKVIRDKNLGYSDALTEIWWEEVLAKSDFLLQSPVVKIDTTGADVLVTDANGKQHAARQVVVTVSVGVLQSESIDFSPDLPDATISAYNIIGMDSGLKVALRFEVPWWETEGLSLAWLVTEGIAGACWVPSDYKAGSSSFIMMCYPMGRNAVALTDIAAEAGGGEAGDEAIALAILKDLDGVFPQALGDASANFLDALVQDWGAEPYTLGAYSYPTIETSNSATDSQRQVLKKPIADNRIFIAGEATHETHSATVVGALHEGERAAMEVHAVNGNPGNPPAMPVYLTVPTWERYRRPGFLPDLNLEPGDP